MRRGKGRKCGVFYKGVAAIVILVAVAILQRPLEDLLPLAVWSLLIGSILDGADQ